MSARINDLPPRRPTTSQASVAACGRAVGPLGALRVNAALLCGHGETKEGSEERAPGRPCLAVAERWAEDLRVVDGLENVDHGLASSASSAWRSYWRA